MKLVCILLASMTRILISAQSIVVYYYLDEFASIRATKSSFVFVRSLVQIRSHCRIIESLRPQIGGYYQRQTA